MSPSTLALAYLALPSSQRLSTDTTPIHLAPAEAAASSCVPTATSATPMACAASAHPYLQVRDSTRAHLAPDAAVASSCVITNMLAPPMACAASAHPSLQVRANHRDASSSDTRCRRSFTLRVHHHASHAVGVRCPRTLISPNACQPSRRLPLSGTRCCCCLTLRVHHELRHADGARCLRTSISPSMFLPTRCKPIRYPLKPQLHLACSPSRH